jgi:P27 family predicted phage terminase small subunit
MGLRGPAPKSTEEKKIAGTYRRDRDAGATMNPALISTAPKPPSWLAAAGKREWKRVAAELVELDILATVDLAALEGYCAAYARAIAAERALKKKVITGFATDGKPITASGLTMLSAQGIIPRPEVNIAKVAWAEARTFASRFGFTPADRPRVKAPTRKLELVRDPWDEVANG